MNRLFILLLLTAVAVATATAAHARQLALTDVNKSVGLFPIQTSYTPQVVEFDVKKAKAGKVSEAERQGKERI